MGAIAHPQFLPKMNGTDNHVEEDSVHCLKKSKGECKMTLRDLLSKTLLN